MQTDSRTSPVLDLADMISGLPPSVAGTLTGLPGAVPRQNRRLPERILVAAHQACDLGDLDVAAQLLCILETVVAQSRGPVDPGRRKVMESLIAAHQRLWHLRHADELASNAAEPVKPGRSATAKPLPGLHGPSLAGPSLAGSGLAGPGFHEPFDMPDFQPNA